MPSVAQQQAQLLAEVGDPNGTLAPLIATLWTFHADRGTLDPWLPYLYAKRAALDVRLAEEQPATDLVIERDTQDKESVRFDHVQAMRDATHAELMRIEAKARSRRLPQAGALTRVEPQTPPYANQPDAADPLYRGSAYAPPLRERW